MSQFDTLDNEPTMPGEPQGKLLGSRYRIVRKLGEGGMGMVYLAEDMELDNTKVAIKFIPPMLAGNPRAIKGLVREAQIARKLSHPNIVRLHDLHTDGHQKFLVMEYIEGKTLEELLTEKDGERLTLDEMLPIAEQIAAGLDYAHSLQPPVLHRDLKPSNIMIDSHGVAKILDFGIAREMKDSFTRVTGQETSGTLPYMSPEQLRGQQQSPAMDVYSFAAILYECLAGHAPFFTGDLRHQILQEEASPIAGVPAGVNRALLCALAKDAQKRAKRSADVVAMLQDESEPQASPDAHGPDLAEPAPAGLNQADKKPRRRTAAVIATLLLVGVATALLIFGYRLFHQQQRRLEAQLVALREQQAAERAERDKQDEETRQAELARQQEAARQAELLKQQQADRQAKEEQARQAELAKQEEASRQAAVLKQQEADRRAKEEEARQAEISKLQEALRQAESLRKQEADRQAQAEKQKRALAEGLFRENFVDNTKGWPAAVLDNLRAEIQGGEYMIKSEDQMNHTFGPVTSPRIDTSSGFEMQVDARHVIGVDNRAFGLFWGARGGRGGGTSGFYFEITANGSYVYEKYTDGKWDTVKEWTQSGQINQGDKSNRLTVRVRGYRLSLLINGEVVHSAPLEPFMGDQFGVTVTDQQTVAFDNFVVRQLE